MEPEEHKDDHNGSMTPLYRAAIFSLLVFSFSACGGAGGGLSPLSPGATIGATSTPQPTPTPTLAPAAIMFGTPAFNPASDGSQDCSTAGGVSLIAINAIAAIPIVQMNHTGSYSVTVSDSSVISASISGSTLTVTALAAGNASATVKDGAGNSAACVIGVTTSGGTVH